MTRKLVALLAVVAGCGGQTTAEVGTTGGGGASASSGAGQSGSAGKQTGGGGVGMAGKGAGGSSAAGAGAGSGAAAGNGVGGIGNEKLPICTDDRKYVPLGLKCPGNCLTDKPCADGLVCCAIWCNRVTIFKPDVHAPTAGETICEQPQNCAPNGTYDMTTQAWIDYPKWGCDTVP